MRSIIIWVLVMLFTVWLTGCGGVSPRPSFYLLKGALVPAGDSLTVPENLSVGIGPVSLPSHLDRPEIVTRGGENGIHINEFHRWAAPLGRQFREILMVDLSDRLQTPRVVLYPWERDRQPRFRVDVTILRFEKGTQGAVMEAIWYIKDVKKDQACMTRKFSMSVPVEGEGMAAYIDAQGGAVAALNREIALGIATAASGCKSPDN